MMRKDEVFTALNQALQAELKAVKMYSAHAGAIAEPEIAQSLRTIEEVEQGHARALVIRIETLTGRPAAIEFAEKPSIVGPTSDPIAVANMLRLDLSDERWAIKHYAATIADLLPDGDDETLRLLEEHLVDELRHARWLSDRLRLLARSE